MSGRAFSYPSTSSEGGRERIRCIDRVPEVRDENRCSELDRHARRYGSQDDKHVPVAEMSLIHT
jgi:hypothetical protein